MAMPGIATHHLFGTDVYSSCSQLVGDNQAARDAFLLGNLGPDPFFYLKALPAERHLRKLGQTMHKQRTPQLLFALHEHLVAPAGSTQKPDQAACMAYALGFVCHYLLDSTVHPLVYAQQHAICRLRLEGLSEVWSHRVVHATIETALDEYVLTSRLGATAATLPPHKNMLRCPVAALIDISKRYAPALSEVYDLPVTEATFATAVSLNRLAQLALDSKSAGLRQRFDYLAGAGMLSAYLLALSHRGEKRQQTPFANDDRVTWEVPFSDGATISASFDDLYLQARERALRVLPAFAEPSFGLRDCEALVGNVNFLGRPVEA